MDANIFKNDSKRSKMHYLIHVLHLVISNPEPPIELRQKYTNKGNDFRKEKVMYNCANVLSKLRSYEEVHQLATDAAAMRLTVSLLHVKNA